MRSNGTLVTFPGKYGDLIWALPTIRAISRRVGEPVDLFIGQRFAPICPLLRQQPYLRSALPHLTWETQETAPISPRTPPVPPGTFDDWDRVYHLGYRGWPLPDVVRHTLDTGSRAVNGLIALDELDLATPWITITRSWELADTHRCGLAIAFTDEHFELKFGLTCLVLEQASRRRPALTYAVLCPAGSRWARETWADTWTSLKVVGWQGYAQILADTQVVLADCSGAHALAVAMGRPVVLMEPNPHRHNAVFYPLGTTGPQVILVTGTDGQPTWDARHVTDVLETALERIPV